jgi:hypothetical protein
MREVYGGMRSPEAEAVNPPDLHRTSDADMCFFS